MSYVFLPNQNSCRHELRNIIKSLTSFFVSLFIFYHFKFFIILSSISDHNNFSDDASISTIINIQVQPDMEELTDNAEEHEDEASKVSEQKLGKLQYKVKR